MYGFSKIELSLLEKAQLLLNDEDKKFYRPDKWTVECDDDDYYLVTILKFTLLAKIYLGGFPDIQAKDTIELQKFLLNTKSYFVSSSGSVGMLINSSFTSLEEILKIVIKNKVLKINSYCETLRKSSEVGTDVKDDVKSSEIGKDAKDDVNSKIRVLHDRAKQELAVEREMLATYRKIAYRNKNTLFVKPEGFGAKQVHDDNLEDKKLN